MLYGEIIAVCFQIHTKHINTLCAQKVEMYIKNQPVPRSKHTPSQLYKPVSKRFAGITHSSVLDLNAACRPKRSTAYWQIHILKCPLKKRSLPAQAVGI
jgi:hypothetical protein